MANERKVIHGDHLCLNDDHLTILGNYCTVMGDFCIVRGDHCAVNGDHCSVYGNNCEIYGDNCFVRGLNCTVYGDNCEIDRGIANARRVRNYRINDYTSAERRVSNLPVERPLNINTRLAEICDTKTDDEKDQCSVCSENARVIALVPCGHRSTCAKCTIHLLQGNKLCPICRREIVDFLRVFG